MNKYAKKIIVIIASLLSIMIIAIGVAVWFVFTPTKLTPVIRTQASKYITCKTEIEDVELTFFSTFPRFGLKVNHFALINKVPNFLTDTLVYADQFIGIIDVGAWWKRDELVLTELRLNKGTINALTDSLGHTNFDIIRPDTIASTADTIQSASPFKFVKIEKVELTNINLSYIDQTQKTLAKFDHLTGLFSGTFHPDLLTSQIDVTEGIVSIVYEGERYMKDASIQLNSLAKVDLSQQSITFSDAKATINEMPFTFGGTIGNEEDKITFDLNYQLKSWPIPQSLTLIPPAYLSYIEDLEVTEGLITSNGEIKGAYNDSLMPLMNLHMVVQKCALKYKPYPIPLNNIDGDIVFYSDMKDDEHSYLQIDQFSAQTPKSAIEMSGKITHFFTDIECDLTSNANLILSDFANMIPAKMKMNLKGEVSGQVKSHFTMSQVDKMQLDKMQLSGKVHLSNFDVTYDSLSLKTDESKVDFELPNLKKSSKNTQFAAIKISAKHLETTKLKGYHAFLNNAAIALETSNVMDSTRIPDVACTFTLDSVSAAMDTMKFAAQRPAGNLTMFPLKGKKMEPEIKLTFSSDHLVTSMGSDHAQMKNVKIKADVLQDNIQPKIKLEYSGENLKMAMGSNTVQMNKIDMNADIVNDKHQKDIFLQWLARGFVNIDKGVINLSALNYPLEIPSIKMDFDPEVFNIKESKLKIDHSDFSLSGTLRNVLSYFRNDSLLRGNFDFVSHHTDAMQLMNLTSGIGDPEEKADTSASGPYMVPKGIDLQLNVNVAAATFGTDSAKMIKGALRVKDGLLVLDNFNFITPAAKMQISTMYRTPRKNHLFMGFECKMKDIEIEELLKMMPDIDSMMSMLRSFKGKGEFNMAAETYLDSLYNPKKSTIRGAASIKGQDLVLMDGPTFTQIAKTLRFNKKTYNKVDSLSAEFTVFKQEVDVYPFLMVMDKYKAVIAGRHNLDLSFDYHISVVDSPLPFKFGINVNGTMDNMKYGLAKCKYGEFYRPTARYEVQNKQLELRKMIREALETRAKTE